MDGEKKPRTGADTEGLFIPNRQLSVLLAGSMVLVGGIFVSGYFLGRQQTIEPFMAKVEQHSFADQVYTALYAQYEHDEASPVAQEAPEEIAVATVAESTTPLSEVAVVAPAAPGPTWYAPLAGYPKEALAQTFAHKLQHKGVRVEVKRRVSMSENGKKKEWYQVVTEPWTNRAALQELTTRIAHEEKLKDVKIVRC